MRRVWVLAAAIILSLAYASPARANYLPEATAMADRAAAAPQPPGFVSFCMRFPAQCAADMNEPERLALTPSMWTEIERINAVVNRAIRPKDDLEHYGRSEYWTIPADGWGDCEDYALAKRKLLRDADMPLRALRIAVVKTGTGMEHAVLTVATDHGDYVLDNLVPAIRGWDHTGYQWIERQDPDHGWGWVRLTPLPSPLLTAASTGNGQGPGSN